MQPFSLSLLLAGSLLGSCAAGQAPPLATPDDRAALPASALAGAVRALETLDAVRPAETLTQVRAVECDTLADPAGGDERVRVFLHLTVYAATVARAREAFEELRAALEAEARAAERAELASSERVRRVMVELDWDPSGPEELLSYSDAIRLEVVPGRLAPEAPAAESPGSRSHVALEPYVRELAARQGIGQVELDLTLDPRVRDPGVSQVRCRIGVAPGRARYTGQEIGAFVAALEGQSPAARVTRLAVERSPQAPDVHAARGWTFEAELAVRARAGGQPAASPASAGG